MMDVSRFYARRQKIERTAGKAKGHNLTTTSDAGLCDDGSCSCGWKSNGYFDGLEYIYKEWLQHLEGKNVKIRYSRELRLENPQENLFICSLEKHRAKQSKGTI